MGNPCSFIAVWKRRRQNSDCPPKKQRHPPSTIRVLPNIEAATKSIEIKSEVTDPVELAARKRWERFFYDLWMKPLHFVEIFSGAKPKDLKQLFEVKLFKEDENYLYLNMEPIANKGDQEIRERIRMALYGPKTKYAYLPAMIHFVHANGDSEIWTIAKTQTNLSGISEKDFQYVKVPGFTFRAAPAIFEKPVSSATTPEIKSSGVDTEPLEPSIIPSACPTYVEFPCVPCTGLLHRLRSHRLQRFQ
jgi:hypothetical protein